MIDAGAGAEDHAFGLAPTKLERSSDILVTAAVDELELLEGWSEADPAIRWRFAPALSAQTGRRAAQSWWASSSPARAAACIPTPPRRSRSGEETLTMVNFVPSAVLLTTFEDEVAPIGVRTLLAGAPQELVAKPPRAATSGATSQRTP